MYGSEFLFFKHCLHFIIHCLSCNAQDMQPSKWGAFLTLIGAAGSGVVQNRIPLTPPTVAGPGIVDSTLYLNKIRSAGSPEAANRVAATEIWGMLAPGLDGKMKPMTESLLDLGKK